MEVVVTYLELVIAEPLPPAPAMPPGLALRRERAPDAAPTAARLYHLIGGPLYWRDRTRWSEANWRAAIDRDDVEVWTARRDDEVIGYFQLAWRDHAAEIEYFGLVDQAIGKGLGRWLLAATVYRAGQRGARAVTVNTCTLDTAGALPNYLGRGFRIVRQERKHRELEE